MSARRAVIYARISVSSEESVSIARQVDSCRKYAEARGWEVVAEPFVDDGVSASKNRPEDRAGWRALLAHDQPYDVICVWKVDRLARRVLDFLHADEALQERGAALVAVEDPIDMSTAQGRAFATMLAVFAEMEAESIRARVKAARAKLLLDGRWPGGVVPFGWCAVPNPHGAGKVLAKDPDRIGYVEAAIQRTLAGRTVYSTATWLTEQGIPTPSWKGVPWVVAPWREVVVTDLLRNPILAGLTSHNPGNTESGRRGDEVLRGPDGLPVVNPALAVMSLPRWRALVKALDERDSPQAQPRSTKGTTPATLSGLVLCGEHDEPTRMWRGTNQGRPSYRCPVCHHTITAGLFEEVVVEEFLTTRGEHHRWTVVEVVNDGAAVMLPEIEHRLSELMVALQATDDDDEAERLQEQAAAMRALRRDARRAAPSVSYVSEPVVTFAEAWSTATDDHERRAVLGDALTAITVRRGGMGRATREKVAARLAYAWRVPPVPHDPENAA